MRINSCVILAGGKGTRLKSITGVLPKSLVNICGESLLYHQLSLLRSYGITRVYILGKYRISYIKKYIKTEKRFANMNISVHSDGEKSTGTIGAILGLRDQLPCTFFVLYGDTFLNIDLGLFAKYHFRKKSSLTLFAHPNNHPYDSDILITNKIGRVIAFKKYPHESNEYYKNLVNSALYICSLAAIDISGFEVGDHVDFSRHFIPTLLKKNLRIQVYKTPEFIYDCGTPERLNLVQRQIKRGIPQLLASASKKSIVLIDRDGTIIRNVDHLHRIDQIEFYEDVFSGLRSLNENGKIVSLITNQPVVARGELSVEGLQQIHNFIEWELGKRGCYLDDIFFCPHHPDRGFAGERVNYKIICNCRKPKTGLLSMAFKAFNGDLASSWIIGDTTSDIKAGHDFGIKTILVKTGLAGVDRKYSIKPDYYADNFQHAVDIILKNQK